MGEVMFYRVIIVFLIVLSCCLLEINNKKTETIKVLQQGLSRALDLLYSKRGL